LQNKISRLYSDAQNWVASEAEKATSTKAQQIEEKIGVWQKDQDKKLTADLEKSGEHFRELWRVDLDLLRSDEAALWEKERRALREDERKFRDSIKESILEEVTRFQNEALSIISAAQEELVKRKTQSVADLEGDNTNGGGGKDDELFVIGKQLSEKHTRRAKDQQTKQIMISSDSLLKKIDDEEKSIETEQDRRDSDLKKTVGEARKGRTGKKSKG